MSGPSTVSPDLSSSTGSNSTPDSFLYETKFIVLSFLKHLTQDDQNTVGNKAISEQRVRQYAHRWKTRSLPSSPPKQRKKHKKVSSHAKRRPFSSDESLHLHVRPTTPGSNTSSQTSESQHLQYAQRKSKKQTVSGRHSVPSQSPYPDSPDSSKTTSSLPARIASYQRSISDGSSQDGGSYLSDADDELDTSQGSAASSLRGSRSSDFLKSSGHHLHVSRLSTVPSESEAEPDLPDSNILNDDSILPIEVDEIEFDITSDQDKEHLPELSRRAAMQNGVAESASFVPHQPQKEDDKDVVDGLTESDVSDIESDEIVGAKDDDDDEDEEEEEEEEEEGKLGEAAGGVLEPVVDAFNGRGPRAGAPGRSHLFLDLSMSMGSPLPQDVDSVITSLREEIQDEMLSLESEMEDAFRSNHISHLFTAPTPAPLTPHSEAAEILARIGDEIVRNNNVMPQVESAVIRLFTQESGCMTYEVFREVAKSIVDESAPGWRQVALLLVYSQSVAFRMVTAGGQGVSNIVDYSVRLLADLTADFIIKQGGWGGLMTTESSSSCISSPEPNNQPSSLPFYPEVSAHATLTHISVTQGSTATGENTSLQTDASPSLTDKDTDTKKPVEDRRSNGDVQGTDHLDTSQEPSTHDSSCPERGDNSARSWWPRMPSRESNSSFVTKCSAALALLSIGLGVAMVYMKR